MSDRLARLLHPAFLLALAVLLLNDHLLKEAVPSVLTGKLSDVAGLIVLPVLLTSLFRMQSRQLVWAVHGTVGLAFAALQFVSPETLWSLTVLPLRHTPDPTDLLALAILPLGVRLSLMEDRRASRSARQLDLRMRPALAHLVGLVAVGAVLATSPPRAPLVVEPVPVLSALSAGNAVEIFEERMAALGFDARGPRVMPYEDWLANQSGLEDGDAARARHAEGATSIRERRANGAMYYRITVPPGACSEAPPAAPIEIDLETTWDEIATELVAVVLEVDYGAGDWQFADEAERDEGRRLVTACVIEPLQAAGAASR